MACVSQTRCVQEEEPNPSSIHTLMHACMHAWSQKAPSCYRSEPAIVKPAHECASKGHMLWWPRVAVPHLKRICGSGPHQPPPCLPGAQQAPAAAQAACPHLQLHPDGATRQPPPAAGQTATMAAGCSSRRHHHQPQIHDTIISRAAALLVVSDRAWQQSAAAAVAAGSCGSWGGGSVRTWYVSSAWNAR